MAEGTGVSYLRIVGETSAKNFWIPSIKMGVEVNNADLSEVLES